MKRKPYKEKRFSSDELKQMNKRADAILAGLGEVKMPFNGKFSERKATK